jgi:hypothetical protein
MTGMITVYVLRARLEARLTQETQHVIAVLVMLGIQALACVTNVLLLVHLLLLAQLNVQHVELEALLTQETQDVYALLLAKFGNQALTNVTNVLLVHSLLLVQLNVQLV